MSVDTSQVRMLLDYLREEDEGDAVLIVSNLLAGYESLLAERDAAYAAGQRDMQERAESVIDDYDEDAGGGIHYVSASPEVLRDAIRALPVKDRPE